MSKQYPAHRPGLECERCHNTVPVLYAARRKSGALAWVCRACMDIVEASAKTRRAALKAGQ